ncbi:anti-sigma factor domain-containing protein [cf. Phormidesmis sp. LEGE 11477]|uniref:anti-sigma factor domain-containing protein n=1 Tax=cf. Phormidesmis sp. LEGE 11477 TaxID=1828680 RepID=UPI00188092AD|nr:anti-sigma factor [cf. Phormidesmis sp. LEGE 11477]MBE9060716.1 anti-sigma factor [cf. Phormidesmis sp. LEGE 11477]
MNISSPSEQQLLLAGYILGDLNADESQAFEQLLANDPTVQQELAQLQSSLDTVYGQEVAPPPALKASVLAAAKQSTRSSVSQRSRDNLLVATGSASTGLEPANTESTSSIDSSKAAVKFQRKILLLVSGVLAALSLYLGSQNYSLRQAVEALQAEKAALEQTENDAELVRYSLDATENATGSEQTSSVEISVNRDRLTAVLDVKGLPVLSEDQVYALWTVIPEDTPATKDAKNAILTAVFKVDEAGNQIEEIVLPSVFREQTQVEAIAVTVESADAPQDHESSPILFRQL